MPSGAITRAYPDRQRTQPVRDLSTSAPSGGPSPAPWIGDADLLRSKTGQHLSGLSHSNVCAADFNGDGLFDLLAGAEKGNLVWYPNHGSPGQPKFVGCRMLTDEEGPIDLGWYGSPFLFDWDNDGLVDLLVGSSHNAIVWWKNAGKKDAPQLSYRGLVPADGKPLAVPAEPILEDKTGVFKPITVSRGSAIDGDGIPDILTAAMTGRCFSIARRTPRRRHRNCVRGRSPRRPGARYRSATELATHDFDGTARTSLLVRGSGRAFIAINGRAKLGPMYYRNAGRRRPQLRREPLPRRGEFPAANIARPSVVDWNADGLPDLVVSDASGAIYVLLNRGQPGAPLWEANRTPLTTSWGFVRDGGFASRAALRPGAPPQCLDGDQFSAYEGSPHSPRRAPRGMARVRGERIHYPGPGYGDPYFRTALCDWDADGNADLLYGTQQESLSDRGRRRRSPCVCPRRAVQLTNGSRCASGRRL
jgi:hypothetical protein